MKRLLLLAFLLIGTGAFSQEVGISSSGTFTPTELLDVDGRLKARGNIYVGNTSGTNNDIYISDDIIDWDDTSFKLDPSGSDSRVNEINFTDGSLSDPSIWFDGDANTGFYQPADGMLGFTINGSEGMRLTDDRYLGIGESAPASRLEVSGNIRIAGTAVANSEAGGMLIYENTSGLGGGTTKKVERRTQIQLVSSGTVYTIYEDHVARLGVIRSGDVYQLALSPKAGYTGWWDMAYDAGGDDINMPTANTWYAITDNGFTLDWGVSYQGGIEYIINKEAAFGYPTYRVWPHLHDYVYDARVTIIIEVWYP